MGRMFFIAGETIFAHLVPNQIAVLCLLTGFPMRESFPR